MVAILNQKIPVFQSTLPREERLFGFGIRVIISIFQSTLPREERRPCSRHSLRILLFQSTLPREERRYPHGLQSLLFHNFNPRSHERSDIPAGSFHCCLHYISIHAPTRGATKADCEDGEIILISIHAPTRGATFTNVCKFVLKHFNPRSHERSDKKTAGTACRIYYFNPRSHERSDGYGLAQWTYHTNFNPRSHERSDSNIAQKICLFLYNTDNKYIIR